MLAKRFPAFRPASRQAGRASRPFHPVLMRLPCYRQASEFSVTDRGLVPAAKLQAAKPNQSL